MDVFVRTAGSTWIVGIEADDADTAVAMAWRMIEGKRPYQAQAGSAPGAPLTIILNPAHVWYVSAAPVG